MVALRLVLTTIAVLTVFGQSAENEKGFWNDPSRLTQLGLERISDCDFREGLALLQQAERMSPSSELIQASLANAFHLLRRLDEAAGHYSRLLKLSPVRDA